MELLQEQRYLFIWFRNSLKRVSKLSNTHLDGRLQISCDER